MNDGNNPPTQKSFFTLLSGETKPTTMFMWFILLALGLHIKSIHWLSQLSTTKQVKPPVEITLLAVPVKRIETELVKPKPVEIPKKKPPLPKAKPKPKPVPVVKLKPAVQSKPVVKTAPMAKVLKAEPKAVETIAPVTPTPIIAPVRQSVTNTLTTTHTKSPVHTEPVSKQDDSVDNDIVEANYRPHYGSNPKPKYPASAQRRHLEGKVLLTVRVSAEGDSENVTVAKSSGHEILDDVAVETVRNWKFVPGRKGSKAIATTVTVPINFKFND